MPVDRSDPLARAPESSATSRSSSASHASKTGDAIEIVLEVEDVEVVPEAPRRRAPPPPPAAALSAPPSDGRRSMVVPTRGVGDVPAPALRGGANDIPAPALRSGEGEVPAPAETGPRLRRKSQSTWPGVQPPVVAAEQPALKRPGAPEEMEPLNSNPNADWLKRSTVRARPGPAPEPAASASSPASHKPEAVPVYLQLEAELERAQSEMDRLTRQMRARDAYLLELERVLAESQAQLELLGVHDAESAAQLLGRLRGQDFRIAELEAELRRRERAPLESERHTEVRPRTTPNRAAG